MCNILCTATLHWLISQRVLLGFPQGFLLAMLGGEIEGASSSRSCGSSSLRGTFICLDVSCLELFNPKGEPHSLSQQWNRQTRAFNRYMMGKEISDDAQKRVHFTCHRNGCSSNKFQLISRQQLNCWKIQTYFGIFSFFRSLNICKSTYWFA